MAKYKCILVTRLPSAQCTVLYCTVPYKCIVVTRLPTVLSSAGAPDLYLLIYKTFYFFALMTISRTLQAEMLTIKPT